jgi:hypothetical protein
MDRRVCVVLYREEGRAAVSVSLTPAAAAAAAPEKE